MKSMILMILFLLIIFLSYKLYLKKTAYKLDKKEKKPEFNSDGEMIVTKEKYVQLLRQNLIDLNNIIDNIVEKDSNDEVWKSNILKALKILDVEDVEKISDEYISQMKNLVSEIENYYNLV